MDEHGWANVEELIDGIKNHGYLDFSMKDLEDIVRTDNKQRYTFGENKKNIRANQGHSINVDVELEEIMPPVKLYHYNY